MRNYSPQNQLSLTHRLGRDKQYALCTIFLYKKKSVVDLGFFTGGIRYALRTERIWDRVIFDVAGSAADCLHCHGRR
jgi:hypothetical protein